MRTHLNGPAAGTNHDSDRKLQVQVERHPLATQGNATANAAWASRADDGGSPRAGGVNADLFADPKHQPSATGTKV